jgi:transcriptional regulator with XRE-family HTH domain
VAAQHAAPVTSPSTWQHDLGLAIQTARRAAQLSQEETATAVGVKQSSVSQWEHGLTAPKTRHLLLLLKLFGDALIDLVLTEERASNIESTHR